VKVGQIVLVVVALVMLGSVGYAAYTMVWGPERIEIAGKSLPELLGGNVLPAALAAVLSLAVTYLVVRPFARFLFPPQIKDGVEAAAQVLKVWDTGTTFNDDPEVGFLLEFALADGTTAQVEAKTVVSRLQVALVQPGITATVRYDPRKPQRLRILTLHIPEAPARNAAARMEELNELLHKGLISEEEHRQKREEILRAL